VEPFCGGLAVALGLRPQRAILNDVNPHLINFYKQLQRGLELTIRMRNEEASIGACLDSIAAQDYPDGLENDEYDATAVHVLGWNGTEAVATGRLVFPPHPLPTEQVAGLVVEPRGRVADVGRMSVLPSYRSYRQAAFVALLCRLYLEMRAHGQQRAEQSGADEEGTETEQQR